MFALGPAPKNTDNELSENPSPRFNIQPFPAPMPLPDAASAKPPPLPPARVKCPECKGSGEILNESFCPACRGTGFHFRRVSRPVMEPCPGCGGSGRMSSFQEERPCSACGGAGRMQRWRDEEEPDGPCQVCDGEPVSEWFTDCELCHATGRISTRQRNRRWLKIVVLKLLKVIVIIALFYLLLGAFVYLTKKL